MKIKSIIKLASLFLSMSLCLNSQATIVQLETSAGPIKINLYDQSTPLTVANFLQYVEDGDYENVIFHRSVSNFIVQGGGFTYNGGNQLNANGLPLNNISSNSAVANEPVFSNVRGTIAMAKLGGNPNSATNQWFINLSDSNQANLDFQNGGFTVFGEVIEDGMDIMDDFAALPKEDFGSPFNEIPLDNYDSTNSPTPTDNNLVIISSISVINTAVNTAADLAPTPTTAPPITTPEPLSSGGGGSFGWLLLMGLPLLRIRRV